MALSRLEDAIRFAAERHAGQERDGASPLPYITHPIEVLTLLHDVGGERDEDLLVASVLHDVLEESETSRDELAGRFGDRVADLVVALTREEPSAERTSGLSKDEIWRLRAEMLLAEIGRMEETPRRIKLADRLGNLREAKRTKKGKKLERYRWQTKRILEIVPERTSPPLWRAILEELEELES